MDLRNGLMLTYQRLPHAAATRRFVLSRVSEVRALMKAMKHPEPGTHPLRNPKPCSMFRRIPTTYCRFFSCAPGGSADRCHLLMSPKRTSKPAGVLLGVMSLLYRFRASLSASPAATVVASAASTTPSSCATSVIRPFAASTINTATSWSSRRRAQSVGFLPLAATTVAYRRAPLFMSRRGSGWMVAPFVSVPSLARQRSQKSSSGVNEVHQGNGWQGRLPSQRAPRRRRTALGMVSDRPFRAPHVEALEEMDFSSLGLLDELVEAMDEFGFKSPSKIQRQAIPQVLNGGNMAIAASTGSGKTLAYLMPLVQRLRAQETLSQGDSEPVRHMQRPRALVLVPTRELAVQVLDVAKRLSRTCKFSSCGIVGGEDYGKQKQRLAGTVDVVVATPGRLLKHQEQGNFFLSKVTQVVVDEMDTMLTQGFSPDIDKLTRPMLTNPERRESTQFVFVTATLTKAVRKLLDEGKYPKVRMLETRDVHHTLPTLNHVMVDIKGRDKMSYLVDVTRQHNREFKRTLIFCNTVKSCQAAEFGLREADVSTLSYHGDVPSDERALNLDRFKAGEVAYLVCTDIAARGLDMPNVDHVVMFDFPLNPIDYLHRSGRTARMGARGRVTSLLAKRDLILAAAIEQAVQAGMPLDELSSRKTDYANGARLGPLFGRHGKTAKRGNHHALKSVMNTRARGPVSRDGDKIGRPRKGERVQLTGVGEGGRTSSGRGIAGKSGGPGRARKYN